MREIISGKLRGAMALVAILVLAVAATGVAAWSMWGPPDPSTASREALFRWLATADISQQPPATQLALVERLESELQAGLPLDGLQEAGQSHQSQIAANARRLKKLWFHHRTSQYDQLAGQQRAAFLDARIQTLLAWSALDAAVDGQRASKPASSAAASFFNDIEQWIADEPSGQRRAQMQSAVYDGVVQWLATRELADQPADVRAQLALLIAEQLDGGLAVASVASQRAAEQQQRLRRNGVLLMESWLVHEARRYDELPAARRTSYLDQQIDRVSSWSVWNLLAGESTDADGANKLGALAQFPQLAQGCVDRAAPHDKPKVQRLLADVQARMFSRWLERAAGRG